jgi:hypothetical protein
MSQEWGSAPVIISKHVAELTVSRSYSEQIRAQRGLHGVSHHLLIDPVTSGHETMLLRVVPLDPSAKLARPCGPCKGPRSDRPPRDSQRRSENNHTRESAPGVTLPERETEPLPERLAHRAPGRRPSTIGTSASPERSRSQEPGSGTAEGIGPWPGSGTGSGSGVVVGGGGFRF